MEEEGGGGWEGEGQIEDTAFFFSYPQTSFYTFVPHPATSYIYPTYPFPSYPILSYTLIPLHLLPVTLHILLHLFNLILQFSLYPFSPYPISYTFHLQHRPISTSPPSSATPSYPFIFPSFILQPPLYPLFHLILF